MFGNPYGTGLSFTKVLSGLSKTLNIANQVIPIYKEAKPMINNARTILGALKEFGQSNNTSNTTNTTSNEKEKDTVLERVTVSPNNPKFFL